MADNFIYSVSSRSDLLEEPFVKKDLVYVLDNNASSYSGNQIYFETSQLANSGRWASYSEAYITIPFVIAARASVDATAMMNAYSIGLKNGYYQLIDSISVDYNSTNVVQLTPYTNFYVNYKCLSSWSSEDVATYGASCLFFPDSENSYRYSQTASAEGIGCSNNRLTISALDTFAGVAAPYYLPNWFNEGLRKRVLALSYATGYTTQDNPSVILQSGSLSGMNSWSTDGAAAAARVWSISGIAKIRLKDLSDFFAQLPLVKGAYLKMTVNVNTSTTAISLATGAAGTADISSVTVVGRTNPIMFSSRSANNPNTGNLANASVLTIGLGIGSATAGASTVSHAYMRSCRLYVPLYTMAPSYEESYLQMNPSKSVVYRDLYSYALFNQSAQGQINQLLTNGIVAPKQLVVVPIITGRSSVAAQNHLSGSTVDPIASPFATEPGTTSFGAALSAFNVQLSGINVFQTNGVYDYEMFLGEVSRANAINGGQSTGLNSGLIDEWKFQTCYRYYVVDLSRGLSADDLVPKSIQLTCQNVSNKALDLYCFIVYEKKLNIDLRTGQVISV